MNDPCVFACYRRFTDDFPFLFALVYHLELIGLRFSKDAFAT